MNTSNQPPSLNLTPGAAQALLRLPPFQHIRATHGELYMQVTLLEDEPGPWERTEITLSDGQEEVTCVLAGHALDAYESEAFGIGSIVVVLAHWHYGLGNRYAIIIEDIGVVQLNCRPIRLLPLPASSTGAVLFN